MSGKIKGKDLSYDKALPPFLQRLHAQKAGHGDADRHEREIARPRKAKDVNDDDGPTVVDERGETLSKNDVEDLTRSRSTDDMRAALDEPAPSETAARQGSSRVAEQKLITGGAPKKRKAVMVLGSDGDNSQNMSNKSDQLPKKPRKKAKPIKLAFANDDDEAH
nr:hypothetical protein CFP56_02593 [Quercus suber]